MGSTVQLLSGFVGYLLANLSSLVLVIFNRIFGDRLHHLRAPYWVPQQEGNIVITGGTSGLGLASARFLGKLGFRLIIIGRDEAKGKAAVERLQQETGNKRIELMTADFGSFKEVRDLAERIRALNIPIHVLMNNAATQPMQPTFTHDGLDIVFQANHFSMQLFTNLLLDRIKEAKPAGRIVNVASDGHWVGFVDLDGFHRIGRTYHVGLQYCDTKLANILFTKELARRLEAEGRKDVLVLAGHPGLVFTELSREVPPSIRNVIKTIGRDSNDGARTQVYLALAPAKDLVSGGYYHDCFHMPSSSASRDRSLAGKLWELTEKLCN